MEVSKSTHTKQTEPMAAFFDKKAAAYDAHMKDTVPSFRKLYSAVATPVTQTDDAIVILDLGCGTGIEIGGLFEKAPNAIIHGIELSSEMLAALRRKYRKRLHQIHLIKGSFVSLPLSPGSYDYAVSVLTMHHFEYRDKLTVYAKIRESLVAKGRYIEGDYVVSPEKAQRYLRRYEDQVSALPDHHGGNYHIDIPFSLDEQRNALLEAGFSQVRIIWREHEAAVFVADR